MIFKRRHLYFVLFKLNQSFAEIPYLVVLTGNGITLKDSDNVYITTGILSLSHLTIYQIINPKRGTWSLTVPGSSGGHEILVMSSTTEIHFEHYFLVALPWGRRHTVEVPISNPVPGEFQWQIQERDRGARAPLIFRSK